MNLTYLVLTKSYEVGSTTIMHTSQDNNHGMVFIAFKTALY